MLDGLILKRMISIQSPKEDHMIARFWHGITPLTKADDYAEYVKKTGIRDLQATPGNKGAFLFRRQVDDQCEFLVISAWESMAAIRRFSGDDVEKARYYPEDSDYLLELEPHVTHYEIVEAKQETGTGP